MAEFVNQQYAAEAQREEQLRQQQMGQLVNQALNVQQAGQQQAYRQAQLQAMEEQQKERKIEQSYRIMTNKELPFPLRAQEGNRFLGLMGMGDFSLTPEDLDYWTPTAKAALEHMKEGRPDLAIPMIEYGMEHHATLRQQPEALQQLQAARQQSAEQVVGQLNRKPTEVEDAQGWIDQYGVQAQNGARDLIQADLDTRGPEERAVVGLIGAGDGKELSPQEAAHQEWFGRYAAEVKQTSGIDITEGLAKPAARPEPTTTPAVVSGGSADWLTDQRDLFNTYKQKQAIVRSDAARQEMAQKQQAWLAAHPKELEAAGAEVVSRQLGVPISGVSTEERLKARFWEMKGRGGPKTKEEETWYNAVEPLMVGHEEMANQRAIMTEERITQNQREIKVKEDALGLTGLTELKQEALKVEDKRKTLREQFKPGLTDEQVLGLKAQEQELDQQQTVISQAMAEESQSRLNALQASSQAAQEKIERLKSLRVKVPSERAGALEENIATETRGIEANDKLFTTLTTYSQAKISEHDKNLQDNTKMRTELEKEIEKAPPDKRNELLARHDHLMTAIQEDTKWLETAKRENAVAQIRMQSHIKDKKSESSALAVQLAKQVAKDKEALQHSLALREYITRFTSGEDQGKALSTTMMHYPLANPNDLNKGLNDSLKTPLAMAAVNLPAAESELAMTVDRTKDLLPQAAKVAKKYGVSTVDLMKVFEDPTKKGQVNVSLAAPGERKEIVEQRAGLREVQNVMRLYDDKYVGRVDDLLAKFKGPLNLLTPEEAEFRAGVKKMGANLRKFYIGAAQSKQELKNLIESIPDTSMAEIPFKAAMQATKDNMARLAEETVAVGQELGMKMPGAVPGLSPNKQQMLNELQRNNPNAPIEDLMNFLATMPD